MTKVCEEIKCVRRVYGNQVVCNTHYQKLREADLTRPRCKVKNCNRGGITLGMCKGHYVRFKKTGDAFEGVPFSKGSGRNTLAMIKLKNATPKGKTFCNRCEKYLKPTKFRKNKIYCVDCRKDEQLIRIYGITLNDYNKIFKTQKGRCKICKTKNMGGTHGVLFVDHDHISGTVRGLLCYYCNRMVMASVDKVGFSTIAKYLGFKIIKKGKKK